MAYTQQQIKETVLKKGYVWFEDQEEKGFDVNIVSIRNSSTEGKVTNLFDDTITVSFKEDGEWKFLEWAGTTDPGKKSILEFQNPDGCAILVPGQYMSCYTIRPHKGQYDAVCQDKPVKVFRDNNRDLSYDQRTIEEGIFGINIHRSNSKGESELVDGWSAGCTVFKRVKDFTEFMRICKKASQIHGNSFTYTLLESLDIVGTGVV